MPEAQHLLGGIGLTKLYALCRTGYLKRVNIGRRGFITRRGIDEYLVSIGVD